MSQAKSGDTVKVHYTGKLDDGTVFDSSTGREPLEFTLGSGQVIQGFDQAIIGMQPNESRTTTVPADEAYGPHHSELVINVDRDRFPDNVEPEVGQQLQMRQGEGRIISVVVTDVSELDVTLDANHPLAGKDLTFDIQLVEIL